MDSEKIDSVLKHLTQFEVKSLISTPPTLEELFIRYYGDENTVEDESGEK